MKCVEFRRRFHRMLDTNQPRIFRGGMSEHLGSCRACAVHVRAMERVDAALRAAPDIQVPPDLLGKLLAIPSKYTAQMQLPTWWDDIRRNAIYVLPVVVTAIVGLGLAPHYELLLQTAIVTIAFVAIALRRTRSLFGGY